MRNAIKWVSAVSILSVSCTLPSGTESESDEPGGPHGPKVDRPADPGSVAQEIRVHDSALSDAAVSDACLESPTAATCCRPDQDVTLGTPRRDHFDFDFGRHHHSRSGFGNKDRCVITFESNDSVQTGRGNDVIHGGEGRDHLDGDGGDDIIIGGGGSDHIDAGSGQDVVKAGPGNDKVDGGHGDDVLDGGDGDDNLTGSEGDDTLHPGPGRDHVLGGRGNDTVTVFDLCEVERDELYNGGFGTDTLITPIPVADLALLGVTVIGFENIQVQSGSCQSECAAVPDCSNRGTCVNGDNPGDMSCDCDPGFSGENCEFESVVAEAGGVAYIAQCDTNEVPTPPVWNYEDAFHNVNGTLWVNDGPLVWPFISQDLVAEAFYYESTDPPGVCIALPRSDMDANGIPVPDGIELLGVICQGAQSSKACFWDSKFVDRFDTLNFTDDCQITGPNNLYLTAAGNPCFIGGTDLALPNATGGTCTSCHRGENVFLIPNAFPEPGPSGLTAAIPQRMPAAWHDPIVDASWPDNPGPFVPTAAADGCTGCHSEAGRALGPLFGGRFPASPGDYCGTVLRPVFDLTMPPGARQECEVATDCPMGMVCEASNLPGAMVCKQPCAATTECPLGYLCEGLRCSLDQSGFPQYQEVLGTCP